MTNDLPAFSKSVGTNKWAVHICVTARVTESFYAFVLMQLGNKHLRQDCESEAGKQKHNDAERRVCIFDWHTCFRVCFPGVAETR